MYLTQGLHRSLQRNPAKTALTHLGVQGSRSLCFEALVPAVARRAAALAAGLRCENDELVALCRSLHRVQWLQATAFEGWTPRDVVAHL